MQNRRERRHIRNPVLFMYCFSALVECRGFDWMYFCSSSTAVSSCRSLLLAKQFRCSSLLHRLSHSLVLSLTRRPIVTCTADSPPPPSLLNISHSRCRHGPFPSVGILCSCFDFRKLVTRSGFLLLVSSLRSIRYQVIFSSRCTYLYVPVRACACLLV